jgi:hypothetical protein
LDLCGGLAIGGVDGGLVHAIIIVQLIALSKYLNVT